MNKVVSLLSGALSLILSIFLIGCKAPSGGGSDSNTNYNYLESHGGMGGAVASPGIKIGNNPMLDNTSEVYAIAPGKTAYFDGSSGHADVPENADAKYKGVFLKNRKVELSPFIIGQYEVTQELYESVMTNEKIGEKFLNATPSNFCDSPAEGEFQNLRPVEQVGWYDAVYFCNVLSTKTNLEKAYVIENIIVDEDGHIASADVSMDITKTGYRLPTEAEWEFAARGGDPTKPDWNYLFSGHAAETSASYNEFRNLDSGMNTVGWDRISSGIKTRQTGIKTANALGLFDMSGNVWEWCHDIYDKNDPTSNDNAYIQENIIKNPQSSSSGDKRVVRGGGILNTSSDVFNVCFRTGSVAYRIERFIGFRVVRSVK